jgi:hypothetical protein
MSLSHTTKQSSRSRSLIERITALLAGSISIIGIGLSQQSSTGDTWQRLLQDAYSAHLSRVQEMLPPHPACLLYLISPNQSRTIAA